MALPVADPSTLPYGSRVVTIGGDDYVADDIEITRPSNVIERTNELGEPSGQVVIAGFVTGTATIQIATAGTLPAPGDTMTEDFGNGDEDFVITEVGQPESKDAAKMARVSFRLLVN